MGEGRVGEGAWTRELVPVRAGIQRGQALEKGQRLGVFLRSGGGSGRVSHPNCPPCVELDRPKCLAV